MKKIADRIIKGKYVVFAVCAALLVVSCIFLPKIGVNYNLSDYLSKDTETRIALDIMEDEFGLTGNVQVMLSGVNESAAKEIKSVLSEIENVSQVEFDAESTNYFKDGKALYIVLIQGDDYSETAAEVISDIKEAVASYDAEFGGTAAQKQSQKEAITRQIPMILAICICIAYGILVVTTRSWLEPLLFLATAGIAVLINLGTNIIFGSISYITNSIAAILQLALAMDYSIMLLHSYHKNRETQPDPKRAMSDSIAECIKPVSASSLTTIAGLLALLFMSFTIGFDIGMVLMKGIVISALVSVTLFPCVILLFDKILIKTKLRTKKKETKGERENIAVRAHFLANVAKKGNLVIVPLVVALVVGAAFVQTGNVYTFTDSGASNDVIAQTFGNSNTVVLVYKSDEGVEKQQRFIDGLANYRFEDGRPALVGYSAYTNTVLEEYSVETAAEKLEIEEETVSQLFALYHLYDAPEILKMTMTEFLSAANGLVLNDPETQEMLPADTALTVQRLYTVNALMHSENTAAEFYETLTSGAMEGFADVTKEQIEFVYALYGKQQDIPADSAIEGNILVDFMLSDPTIRIFLGSKLASVQDMSAVYQTFLKEGEYTFVEVAEELSALADSMQSMSGIPAVGADQISGVYFKILMNGGNIPASPVAARDLLGFVSENMDKNALLLYKMDDGMRAKVAASQKEIDRATELFLGDNYTRVLFNVDVPGDGAETYAFAEYANALAAEVFEGNGHVAGEIMSTSDLKQSFGSDQILIGVFTIVSIFLIVLIIFRSRSIPVLLVAVIQGAVWRFLSVFALASSPIFFMSYIVTNCILMGATIDYGILLSSNYVALRKKSEKFDALSGAVSAAMPTILSSGSVLMCCGFVIRIISSQNSIATVGLLLGVGTISSVVMILFALPSLLYLCDKIVMKTTWGSRKKKGKE